jgi:hypothetical protein
LCVCVCVCVCVSVCVCVCDEAQAIVDNRSKPPSSPSEAAAHIRQYTEELGITELVNENTIQYANWSAVTELRILSRMGVQVKKITHENLEPFVGRGADHKTVKVALGGQFKYFFEQLAWIMDIPEGKEADLYVCSWAIVVRLLKATSLGKELDRPQEKFLHYVMQVTETRLSHVALIAEASTNQLSKGTDDNNSEAAQP